MDKRVLKGVAIGVSLVALAVYSGFLYEDHAAGRLHHHDHSDHYHDHSHSEKVMLPEKLLYPFNNIVNFKKKLAEPYDSAELYKYPN